MIKEIELLAPAKNLEYGIEAINCGADAVYIGASKFGARYAAGNSIENIGKLCCYAHQFGCRVYVTLNTILFEDELKEAKEVALKLCDIGVDAFIVQDMAYMEFGLPIQLHASTQTAAHSLDRVKFLENVGFDRVVLERALSAEQIKYISDNSNIELEAFVHGAICVSYSGECYMGLIMSGRSGNRGVCSQPCRATYNLLDNNGNYLERDKNLLSVKDMMLSSHLGEMMDMGVVSFKIEGRLKDISYLKNSVLHYRREIDKVIRKRSGFKRASKGESVIDFNVELNKSFTRGFGDYFWSGNKSLVGTSGNSKSIGEFLGRVKSVGKDNFVLDCKVAVNNGDGICFFNSKGKFGGTNVNISDSNKIFPNRIDDIDVGSEVYRNFDIKYNNRITSLKLKRSIDININVSFDNDMRMCVEALDVSGVSVKCDYFSELFDIAKDEQRAQSNLVKQFLKSGDTIFNVCEVNTIGSVPFIPISEINRIRRDVLEKLITARESVHIKLPPTISKFNRLGSSSLSYKANVSNSLARKFYQDRGVEFVEEALECRRGGSYDGVEAMVMKYCIRRERGECLMEGGVNVPLFLEIGGRRFEIVNDCKKCETKLIYKGDK